jgi:hypothetical protein
MKIISSQSDEDIRRNEAAADMAYAIRILAANLLRVVRGAGKAYGLLPQCLACVEAARAYYDAHGHWPSTHLYSEWLNWDSAESAIPIDKRSAYAIEREMAERQIARGVLQIVASRLLGERPQEAAGHREFADGLDILERARKTRVAEMRREIREFARPESNRRKKRPKPSDPGGEIKS